MILHKSTFGPVAKSNRQDAEDVAEGYIGLLLHNGQACGEYFTVLSEGNLVAYVMMQGIQATKRRFHCKYGRKSLNSVTAFFGRPPEWKVVDDEVPARDINWQSAPFLYLFTHVFTWSSSLRRGDNGRPIPIYRLRGRHEDRDAIYSWQGLYRKYDGIWLASGVLEIPVYKQLADPSSELSQKGREICRAVERFTGVPTYYFLMRYWGRRKGQEKRTCPGCGGPWRTDRPLDHPDGFWEFAFQCHKCRLVSHIADTYEDERHAVIGEYPKPPKHTNRRKH